MGFEPTTPTLASKKLERYNLTLQFGGIQRGVLEYYIATEYGPRSGMYRRPIR